jgi:hypothetical protein
MSEHKTVTVYSFRVNDLRHESPTVSSFKASRELIRQRFNGKVLEGTAEAVSITDLDAEGRYRRIATGWGELP